MTDHTQSPPDENKLIAERRSKLDKLRGSGIAFPNDFRRDALADQLLTAYGERAPEWFDQNVVRVKVGGRMMAKRISPHSEVMPSALRMLARWNSTVRGETPSSSAISALDLPSPIAVPR